jgi:hypothetical protein
LLPLQASSLAHLSRQTISIFSSVSHADLDGHLPKMAQLEWKIFAPKVCKDPADQPVFVAALHFCRCGCETLAVADGQGQVALKVGPVSRWPGANPTPAL